MFTWDLNLKSTRALAEDDELPQRLLFDRIFARTPFAIAPMSSAAEVSPASVPALAAASEQSAITPMSASAAAEVSPASVADLAANTAQAAITPMVSAEVVLDPGVRQTSLVSIRTDTVELFVRHLLWLAQEEP